VIDFNEWKTEKRHECANMGKVKRLELWWQLYRTSIPARDLENFRPMDFCWTECTYTPEIKQNKSQRIIIKVNKVNVFIYLFYMKLVRNLSGFPCSFNFTRVMTRTAWLSEFKFKKTRGAQILQKSRRHLKILGVRRVTWSKTYTDDPTILGAPV